jgi:hypothetical protein
LVDGNRITLRTETAVYRDNEGRTRRETEGKRREILIVDPVATVSYTLFPQERVAHVYPAPVTGGYGFKLSGAKRLSEIDLVDLQVKKLAREMQETKSETKELTRSKESTTIDGETKEKRSETAYHRTEARTLSKESLGQQVIEGVQVDGTRTTVTIAAGEIGNEKPIQIVAEQWYSPELQVLVMTRRSDPRDGVTTYRLTRINRTAPDPALFQIPPDYRIESTKKPVPAGSPKPSAQPKPSKPATSSKPAKPGVNSKRESAPAPPAKMSTKAPPEPDNDNQ